LECKTNETRSIPFSSRIGAKYLEAKKSMLVRRVDFVKFPG
jgi:hypothetical protein